MFEYLRIGIFFLIVVSFTAGTILGLEKACTYEYPFSKYNPVYRFGCFLGQASLEGYK